MSTEDLENTPEQLPDEYLEFLPGDIVRYFCPGKLNSEFLSTYGHGPFIVVGPHPLDDTMLECTTMDHKPLRILGKTRIWRNNPHGPAGLTHDRFMTAVARAKRDALP